MTIDKTEKLEVEGGSAYYQHTRSVPLASRISQGMRARMFQLFVNQFQPTPDMRVLDVGVTSDTTQAESNYFEKLYPYPDKITCVGTEDGSHLSRQCPGLRYERVMSGQPLPFEDQSFDVVFSNAVLEHVGSREEQAALLRELLRVGKAFFVTTPNRWFPVEHHTGVPLLHFLPASLFREIIRHTKYRYWATESHLNILTAGELKQLFPSQAKVTVKTLRFFGFGSNLIAFGKSKPH
jgi:SAM-dependent methyltransferase